VPDQLETPMENTITIDEEEMILIDRYEAIFKEIPFIAFLHPDESKRLLKKALKSKTPYKFEDIGKE
jgi:hypothetical protein